MILGIGTDLANIDRIQGVLTRHGDRFKKRVFIQSKHLPIKFESQPPKIIV